MTSIHKTVNLITDPCCSFNGSLGKLVLKLGHGWMLTVYPKKYAHGFCFAVLCCGYTLTDFPISIRLTSLALWQSNDCPSASKATLMNMDKYLMWIHYERLHNHNKAKHNKTVCIFLGIYYIYLSMLSMYYLSMPYSWLISVSKRGSVWFRCCRSRCIILISHYIIAKGFRLPKKLYKTKHLPILVTSKLYKTVMSDCSSML